VTHTATTGTTDSNSFLSYNEMKDRNNSYSSSSSGSYADTDIDSVYSDDNDNSNSSSSSSNSSSRRNSSDSAHDDCTGYTNSAKYGMYSTDKLTTTVANNRPILPPSILIEILTFTDR
jgi:hypothetical protein